MQQELQTKCAVFTDGRIVVLPPMRNKKITADGWSWVRLGAEADRIGKAIDW